MKRLPLKARLITAAITAFLLLLFIAATTLTLLVVKRPTWELGEILIDIDEGVCNISAEFVYKPEIETSNEDLELVLETGSVPLDYSRGRAETSLVEDQFREIIIKEEALIRGELDAEVLPLIEVHRSVDEIMDLSFIGDLLDSIEVLNTNVTPLEVTLLVDFDISASIREDVTIHINETPAKIIAGPLEYEIMVRELTIFTDDMGHGQVEIRSSALLALSLFPDDVNIDAWGLMVEFDISGYLDQ
ncbi:MAG: hypothetical protein ACMUIE_06880 [Thermoplasmatota archaeon]